MLNIDFSLVTHVALIEQSVITSVNLQMGAVAYSTNWA